MAAPATRLPQVRALQDGRRLHIQDGPVDLIIEAWGTVVAVHAAYAAATERMTGLLDELCTELPALRQEALADHSPLQGPVARRMYRGVAPYAAGTFITPMAAVAGAVADEVLASMIAAAPLERAYVNDGGDIALHVTPGTQFQVGLISAPNRPGLFSTARITAEDGIGGIATSGWRGRSFSLGIADAVTILGRDAASADAAATIVANAVDLPGHPAIRRRPARDLQPDSDLGARLVTSAVGPLTPGEIARALDRGIAMAETLTARGLIVAAALRLAGIGRLVDPAGQRSTDIPSPPIIAAPNVGSHAHA